MTRGVILIVTTWILAILTLFAIGIGFRAGLEIKLTGYNLDKLKTLYIAKAGIKKAVIEKWKEYAGGKSLGQDAFSETWANNEEYFKDKKAGEGNFTLSYLPRELDRSDKEIILYGLEDETSKININSQKAIDVLKDLFIMTFKMDLKEAEDIAAAIEDWRDEDNIPKSLGDVSSGAEDSYYQTLETPYLTSGQDFRAVEELLLVKGVTTGLFYDKGLVSYITVYGDGKININTASKEVLNALFGIGYPELASKIVNYRRGVDGKIGTDDDRWFAKGKFVIEREKKGMVEVKDLNDENWYGNIFGIEDHEYRRVKDLAGAKQILSTSSDFYRASITASVKNVKKAVTTVIKFNKPSLVKEFGFTEEIPPPDVEYLFWHEER